MPPFWMRKTFSHLLGKVCMITECAYSKSTTRGLGHIASRIDPASRNKLGSSVSRSPKHAELLCFPPYAGRYGLCCSRTGAFDRSCSGVSPDSFQTYMTLASSICRVDE